MVIRIAERGRRLGFSPGRRPLFICLWYNDLPALPNQDLRRTVMQKDTIKIDVGLIPNYVRDDLAAATLEFMKRILEQPGGREMLDTKMTQRAKK